MNKLIRIKYNNPITYGNLDAGRAIDSNFFISQYPVTIREYRELMEGASDEADRKFKKRATWLEAVRYCNRLNMKSGLPPSYDEETGWMIDEHGQHIDPELDVSGFKFRPYRAKGFRLPTYDEWQYAAKGWTPVKTCDCYYKILENLFRTWDMDREVFFYGMSELEKMEANTIGLYGMLANAREWYSDNLMSYYPDPPENMKNKLCYWEEYYCRNDTFAYQLSKKVCDDTETFGFRVVINFNSISSTPFFRF